MKSAKILLLLTLVAGCDLKSGGSGGGGKISRLNEFRFRNYSGEQLSKVVVQWNDEEFTLTNKDRGLERGSSVLHKLPIRGPVDTTFKITVHFAAGGPTVVHEEKISLRPEERKLIEFQLSRERKILVSQKKRNPHILPAR